MNIHRSILQMRRKEIEEASFTNKVSSDLLKRYWNLGSKWGGEKNHE
jgi:hypothetical protein